MWPDPTYWANYNAADYYIGKGMNTFRLPFRWERLQPQRGQPLDATELERLRTTVRNLASKGAYVVLDVHNYSRLAPGPRVIGAEIPLDDFADFWGRLAEEFRSNERVIFGLMNEPHDVPTELVVSAHNAAIAAIRERRASNLILVSGNGWSAAKHWTANWYGTPNAHALLSVVDPQNHLAFEAHQYFDALEAGGLGECASASYGFESLEPFTTWLRAHGKKGFIGEFGAENTPTCRAAVHNFLQHIDANRDVYLGWTAWAGGPSEWWQGGQYPLLLEPVDGQDRPVFDVLECHLQDPVDQACSAASIGDAGAGSGGTAGKDGGTTGGGGGGGGGGGDSGDELVLPSNTDEASLFVGHSLVNLNLPWQVRQIARALGIPAEYRLQVNNGASLLANWQQPSRWNPNPIWHAELGRDIDWGVDYRRALASGVFDDVVLTEAQPFLDHLRESRSVESVGNYYRLAAQFRPDVRVHLYETWPHLEEGWSAWRAQIADEWPAWQRLSRDVMADRSGPEIRLIPGGQALAALYDRLQQTGAVGQITAIGDVFEDDIHLTDAGNYFIACVIVASVYGRDPSGTPAVQAGPYRRDRMVVQDDATRAELQALAWRVASQARRPHLPRRGAR